MCTSIAVNKKKTIIGWNLDILDMEYRVRPSESGVYTMCRRRRYTGARTGSGIEFRYGSLIKTGGINDERFNRILRTGL